MTKLIHGFSRAYLTKEQKAMITQGLALGGLFGGLSYTSASRDKQKSIHLSIDPREQRMLTAQMSALREFINNVIVSIWCHRSQGQVASFPTGLSFLLECFDHKPQELSHQETCTCRRTGTGGDEPIHPGWLRPECSSEMNGQWLTRADATTEYSFYHR